MRTFAHSELLYIHIYHILKTFEELGVAAPILKAIQEMGYESPMPVQEEVIPFLLGDDNDVIALAQTGTGKTAAFGLPILQKIDVTTYQPQALVLCPTRELCLQIADDLNDYSKYIDNLKVLPVYGGSSIESQIKTLKRGVHVVVATPGRLLDLMNRKTVNLSLVKNVIMDEADKMNQMVKKLLTLNQLESGNETITMERFDVTELIRGVLHSVDILIGQSGITVTECPTEPIYVWADEFMTEEVVTNYLSNAIHYAGGKKEISIRCREQEKNVRISVFNTGDPIPEEDIDKIWFKFYKVDKARTREYGGSGIGLSIVKAIMDSFHQRCGVINHEDGVEFWFELEKGKQS